MSNTQPKSFIQTGALMPALARLSLPILAGQASNLLYNLVDTYFIGRINPLDPWLVGATGLVWPIYFVFMATGFGITGGVASLVARTIGAGREQALDRSAESGLALALTLSLIGLLVFYPVAVPLLKLFGGRDQLLAYGLEYFYWVLPTLPFMLLNAVFIGILQGEGRTKQIMVSMIIGTITNLILDPLLIFSAGLGIAGAGLATVIGNAVGFSYLLVVFLVTPSAVKIDWELRKVSLKVIAEIVRVGLPQSLSNFLASISFIFYNRMIVDLNPLGLTAFTLYSRLEQVALIPIWSLTGALSAVAGQAAGAANFRRLKNACLTATRMGLVVSGSLFLVFVLNSSQLFAIFQSDPAVLKLASQIVIWMAVASFLTIPVFMINTVMAVTGFASRNLILTAIRIYLFNIPACAVAAYLIGKSVGFVMMAIAVASAVSLILYLFVAKHFFNSLASGRLVIRQLY